jgi:hypothetical protein
VDESHGAVPHITQPVTGQRLSALAFGAPTTSFVIEAPGVGVPFQHPQVEPSHRCMIDHRSGGGRQQQGTEPPALQGVGHVEIVEEGTPRRIVVEVGVDKADDVAAKVSDDCPMVGIRSRQAGAPHIPSIIEYFTV